MRILFILTWAFYCLAASAQDSTIEWQATYRLTWEDFLAKAPEKHEASAMTDATLSIGMQSNGKELNIMILPYFNRYGSWVKVKDKNDELLRHEQLHFDIHELSARRFRAELKQKKLTMKNVAGVMEQLMKKYTKQNFEEQERYDRETDHSTIKSKQEEWEKNVAKELNKLKAYSSGRISVKLAE